MKVGDIFPDSPYGEKELVYISKVLVRENQGEAGYEHFAYFDDGEQILISAQEYAHIKEFINKNL